MRFSSKPWDALGGTYDFGFRQYAPNLGRWLNQDPLGEAGGLNLYGFVHNNPLIYADPLGLQGYIGYAPPPARPDPIVRAMQQANVQRMFPGPTILPAAIAAQLQADIGQLEYGLAGLVYDLMPLGSLWESGTGTDFFGDRLTRDERNAALKLAAVDLAGLAIPGTKGKVSCARGPKVTPRPPAPYWARPPQYYVSDGVRRSLAARESGVPNIQAKLVRAGQPDESVTVHLDQLHSPKASIDLADPRFSPSLRPSYPPILIQPLGAPGQLPTVPLLDVEFH